MKKKSSATEFRIISKEENTEVRFYRKNTQLLRQHFFNRKNTKTSENIKNFLSPTEVRFFSIEKKYLSPNEIRFFL